MFEAAAKAAGRMSFISWRFPDASRPCMTLHRDCGGGGSRHTHTHNRGSEDSAQYRAERMGKARNQLEV